MMHRSLTILIVSCSVRLGAQILQPPVLLNYLSICDNNYLFENHYRINNRIVYQQYQNELFKLQIDIYGNCAIGDTSWIEFSHDTLYIWTGPIEKVFDNVLIIIAGLECDCYFHLYYDILNLNKIPEAIIFNNQQLILSDNKFLPEKYSKIDIKEYIIYDSNGASYEYEFYENGSLKWIIKGSGQVFEKFFFDEKGELIEICYDSRAIENGKRKCIRIE